MGEANEREKPPYGRGGRRDAWALVWRPRAGVIVGKHFMAKGFGATLAVQIGRDARLIARFED